MAYEKPDSPFTPGRPVPAEFFVGRKEQVNEILRYIASSVRSEHLESILIYGDRGIGKSSLAICVSELADRKYDIVPVHISLAGTTELLDTLQTIIIQTIKKIGKSRWFEKVESAFGKHIKKVGLWGFEVEVNIGKKELLSSVNNFDMPLKSICEKIANAGKKGLVLVLDDINGLVDKSDFANWYKGFSDGMAINRTKLPVSIIMITTKTQRERLCELQPSLMRIFRPAKVERLSDKEVGNFFPRIFTELGMHLDNEALSLMTDFSSGLPIMMQEIGDAVFWFDNDGKISHDDAANGVLNAADKVGEKYLTPTVFNALKSEKYRSILRLFGRMRIGTHFTKSEIEEHLNEKEKKVLHNFLSKMKKLEVIQSDFEGGLGTYQFTNELYHLYIMIEADRHEKKKR